MKKSIFILAVLFATTYANAQLTPDFSEQQNPVYPAAVLFSDPSIVGLPLCPFFVRYMEDEREFLNPFDYSTYKTINFSSLFSEDLKTIIPVYDIFVVDKLAFLLSTKTISSRVIDREDIKIIDENGNVILNLPSCELAHIAKYGDIWKLWVARVGNIEIYSFPGDGSMPSSSQDVSSQSAPQRPIRKIARDGQVLVETETNTYTLQGAEVK